MLGANSYSSHINWDDLIKKEARDIDNEEVGEVQEVTPDYLLVEKGLINKEKFYIPRNLVAGYNGATLIFNMSFQDLKNKFLRPSPPIVSQSEFAEGATISDDLIIVPVIAEKLEIDKKVFVQEAKIVKETITDVKTTQISLLHEELYIETRPINDQELSIQNENKDDPMHQLAYQSNSPIENEEEVANLFLKIEIPEVSKHPYLKEEIVIKKQSITKTKRISEQIRSEQLNVEGV
jgi:uncharacterized protein (TIGR02271 family)